MRAWSAVSAPLADDGAGAWADSGEAVAGAEGASAAGVGGDGGATGSETAGDGAGGETAGDGADDRGEDEPAVPACFDQAVLRGAA